MKPFFRYPLLTIILAASLPAFIASAAEGSDLQNQVAKFSPPQELGIDLIETSILNAGRHRGYSMLEQGDDWIVFNLENRGINATYTVRFDTSSIEIYSKTYRTKKPDIPYENPSWSANLQKSIEVYLDQAVIKVTDFEEVTNLDPEGYDREDTGKRIDSFPVPAGLDSGDVQEMIAMAAIDRSYSIVARLKGLIAVRLIHKGYSVTYTFKYDDSRVDMYSNSFKLKKPDVQEEVPNWTANLNRSIDHYFEIKAL